MGRQHKTSATSRERNRIHARKTRQRKKEQMQSLQSKAEQLKHEQVQLKMSINEKNTANILACLFSKDGVESSEIGEDPRIEALLRRPTDDIPDASKLPALQPLILPSGAQHCKKSKTSDLVAPTQELPDDGIDYDLLGKDRSKCTPAELDQIRKERNRMHAKRTRDRKRLFMEEMADMCKTLEDENVLLRRHLNGLNGGLPQEEYHQLTSMTISPSLPSISPPNAPTGFRETMGAKRSLKDMQKLPSAPSSKKSANCGQLGTLLQAAGASARTYHPYSSGSSSSEGEDLDVPSFHNKRRRLSASSEEASSGTIPKSITTTAASSLTSIGV